MAAGAAIHAAWDRTQEPLHSSAAAPSGSVATAPIVTAVTVAPVALSPPPVEKAPAEAAVQAAPLPPIVVTPSAPAPALEPVAATGHSRSHRPHGAARVDPIAAPPVATTPPPVAAPVPEAPQRDKDLAAERSLLETARTALGRGQVASALATLERHAQQFPRGRLVEERESVWVQALVEAGRRREAEERAERFRQRFPHSFLRPAVEAAVGAPR